MSWASTLENHPDYVHAIGMISIENANLELGLSHLFAEILMIPRHVGEAVYLTPRSAFARLDILRSAATARYRPRKGGKASSKIEMQKAAALASVLDIEKRARSVIGRRHEIIHNLWGVTEDEPTIVSRTELPRPRPGEGKRVTLSELNNLIRDTRGLIGQILIISSDFVREPPLLVDMRIEPRDRNPSRIRRTPRARKRGPSPDPS